MDKPNDQAKTVETEEKILDAARTVFVRTGTAGARMAEIAKEAGVNQALLHYYFRSKERLANAVFERIASRLFPGVRQALMADTSLDDKIDQLVGLYMDNLLRHPFLPGYMLSELHHHPDRLPHLLENVLGVSPRTLLEPVLAKLAIQIDEQVRAGRMRAISPEQFAINIISLCVFPFAARPMLRVAFGMDDAAFAHFIEQRKKELPEFIRQGLRA